MKKLQVRSLILLISISEAVANECSGPHLNSCLCYLSYFDASNINSKTKQRTRDYLGRIKIKKILSTLIDNP